MRNQDGRSQRPDNSTSKREKHYEKSKEKSTERMTSRTSREKGGVYDILRPMFSRSWLE
jgi:hypothetical protein